LTTFFKSTPFVKQVYFFISLAIFVFLSIPSFTLIEGVRIGQLFILITFMLFIVDDILNRELKFDILLYFFISAVVMSLISFNSTEIKFKEINFLVKYFLLFPAAYYVGARVVKKMSLEKFILMIEIVLFVYCLNAFIVEFVPLPQDLIDKIVSYRSGFGGSLYLDYQGTFLEAGWLALCVGGVLSISFLTRFQMNFWPKNMLVLYLLYGFSIITLGLSKNKTVWIALVVILIILVLYKIILLLLYSNRYKPKYLENSHPVLKLLSSIDSFKVILSVLLFIVLFFIINSSLSDPIISEAMILEKLEKERGKAFLIIMDLLKDSYMLGGYGFGFVEAYFTLKPQEILGLGEGSGMVFNSYLDIWLSVSIFGLIFHLGLIYISSDSRYFITLVLPLYCFIFANFNPAIGDEFYYLFLGVSFGIAKELTNRKVYE